MSQFLHGEAFCHMSYKCKKCHEVVSIWNSRDGVTPFGGNCVQECCDGSMQHENFSHDRFDPRHQPANGDLIWADFQCDEERGKELAIKRIDVFKGTEFELKPGTKEYDDMVESLAKSFMDEAKRHSPELYVVRVTHERYHA